MEWPAAFMHKKPKPAIKIQDKAAGIVSEKGDIFRSCLVVPTGNLLTYKPADRWNQPGTTAYSSVPGLIIGEPFDTSKPRIGRWGEVLGSKISRDSEFFDLTWDKMKISRTDREEIAMEEARRDLQRRIDICLYGTPRFPEVQLHPCPVSSSHAIFLDPVHYWTQESSINTHPPPRVASSLLMELFEVEIGTSKDLFEL